MENTSLGSTIRNALLKYAVMERISIWDFNGWNAIWMTLLSSYRVSITILAATCITVGSLGYIIIKKKEFTQKDTLCAFVFMVVSIFLLESVQKMLKIEVALDGGYTDVEVTVPFSFLIVNTPSNRQMMCKNPFNDKLEKTKDQMQMGDRAAEAYRRLVRETMLRKRPRQEMGILQAAVPGRLDGQGPVSTEYCIYKKDVRRNNRNLNCPGCMYLEEKEFNEAKADLLYIDKVNKEYQEIEKNVEVSRNTYRRQSVELMKNFKELNKVSYFVRDEMSTVGISYSRIESAILGLVNKYELIFAGAPKRRTRLRSTGDSLCVSIVDPLEEKRVPQDVYQIRQKRIKKKTKIIEETGEDRIGRGVIVQTGLLGNSIDSYARHNDQDHFTIADAVHDMIKTNAEVPILQNNSQYQSKRSKTDPFFKSMGYALTTIEIALFIQVLLVLGVIISIIFDKRWLYFMFYICMCGSLVASLFLGYVAFVNSAVLSSLCKEGLKCDMQRPQEQEQVKTVGSMIDIPEKALKRSVERSADRLQKQINTVLTSNTSENIQAIRGQIDRIFQIRKDFDDLISTNPHRNLVKKREIYAAAERINKTLDDIKSLDKEVRNNQWTETFKKISQVNILLISTTNKSNKKKREVLSSLSHHPVPVDGSQCAGKEQLICELKSRFDSLFIGLFIFSVVLSVAIAI